MRDGNQIEVRVDDSSQHGERHVHVAAEGCVVVGEQGVQRAQDARHHFAVIALVRRIPCRAIRQLLSSQLLQQLPIVREESFMLSNSEVLRQLVVKS